MKLDIDCVRDIMLWVEETTTPKRLAIYVDVDLLEEQADFLYLNPDDIPKPDARQQKLLEIYPNEVLIYHIHYCVDGGLLDLAKSSDCVTIVIRDLTVSGHEFIANIRENKNFKAIKKIMKIVGVESIRAITAIASQNTFQNINLLFSTLEKLY